MTVSLIQKRTSVLLEEGEKKIELLTEHNTPLQVQSCPVL